MCCSKQTADTVQQLAYRILHIFKTADGVGLQNIFFDIYYVCSVEEYVNGDVVLGTGVIELDGTEYFSAPTEEDISRYIQGLPFATVTTDESGCASFNFGNENDGIYIVTERENAVTTGAISPFFVAIPGGSNLVAFQGMSKAEEQAVWEFMKYMCSGDVAGKYAAGTGYLPTSDAALNSAVYQEMLQKYPNLKGILGTSSFDAPGVARAIDELGLIDKCFTTGTGMPADNAALLKSGTIKSLTLWDPAIAGQAMIALAVKVLNKEAITGPVDLGVEGYKAMEFRPGSSTVLEGQGWITINAENVDSFGF